MLNKDNERELAYIVLIDGIEPIPGYDRVEHAIVGGWRCIVQKGQFNVGDPAIYFEIDSRVPKDKECFAFLEKRNYKIKTLKMCKTISQGLLMHPSDFGWTVENAQIDLDKFIPTVKDNHGTIHFPDDETRFVTKLLSVTYADDEDNKRKANHPIQSGKYHAMVNRHRKLFKTKPIKWLMKRSWGKKLLFFFFGKKKDKKNGWPAWVAKTDEERVQNMPWILNDTGIWVVTEKIDGSSTTFTMKRGKKGKNDFYVCSRNVCFDTIDKPCYYDTNIYWEMAQKYDMYNVLTKLLEKFPNAEWVTVQGETFGEGVQKRNYSLEGHDFRAFNLITSDRGRFNTIEMAECLDEFGVPSVPILVKDFDFQKEDGSNLTVDELLDLATGASQIDNLPREGFVLRSADGTKSFKVVSNSFLLKFHG